MDANCMVCGGDGVAPFYWVDRQPVLSTVLWSDAEQARRAPTGPIGLAGCPTCGFVRNTAFEPERVRYSTRYENALHYSPTFRGYAESLASRLVERYDVRRRRVIDIGCGNGRFLSLLCRAGDNSGIGYDEAYQAGELDAGADVTIRAEPFSAQAVREADLISCQHVLEHIDEPREFLADIAGEARQRAADRPLVAYFEVPNGAWVVEETQAWDVIYEHCSYFSPASLRRLFEDVGFRVADMGTAFQDQYLWVEALIGGARSQPATSRHLPSRSGPLPTGAFSRQAETLLAGWRERLEELSRRGEVVLWGAGAKTVTFLNRIDRDRRLLGRIADLNPRKQGKFVTGTGHSIVAPSDLTAGPPATILVMNGLYEQEVAATCRALGLVAPAGSVCRAPGDRRAAA